MSQSLTSSENLNSLEARLPPNLLTVGAFLASFIGVWTLYAAISQSASAINHDMAEAYVWGRQFELGYYKHPPIWAWIAGMWFMLFPAKGWAFSLLSMTNAGVGLVGAYRLMTQFSDKKKSLIAFSFLLIMPFYTFMAFTYNANSIFLSLWPWTLVFFVRSIDQPRFGDAALFGIFLAADMLSKYSALILVATCLVASLIHPNRQKYFASPMPYVSAAIGLTLVAPHFWWLVTTGFLPFQYFAAETGRPLSASLWYAAELAIVCLAFQLPFVLLLTFVNRMSLRDWKQGLFAAVMEPRFRFLATIALLPLMLILIAGVAFRLKLSSNMTTAMFGLMPLFWVLLAGTKRSNQLLLTNFWIAATTAAGALAISPAVAYAEIYFGEPAAVEPRMELAAAATRLWHLHASPRFAFVAGSFPYASAIAFYSVDQPLEFINFDFRIAPWVSKQDLSRRGFLAACVSNDMKCLSSASRFETPQSLRIETSLAHSFLGYRGASKKFVLFIVPPQEP